MARRKEKNEKRASRNAPAKKRKRFKLTAAQRAYFKRLEHWENASRPTFTLTD
jgi:hypothetical protein